MNVVMKSVLVSAVIGACAAQAATRTWQSGGDGVWTSTSNWAEGAVPVSGDTADLSAAAGTISLTADVDVGEILFNPAPVGGTTNTLTLLSDTDAPSSRIITLTATATNRVQVGAGAELLLQADLKPTVNTLKDGQGTLVIKRRLFTTVRIECYIEQGRLVNEGAISFPGMRLFVGTLEPEAGAAPEFVMREGAACYSTGAGILSDLLLGGNRLLGSGTGSRAVITHEGGVLDLTTNLTGGAFLNGYAAGGNSVYNLSGGEVNLRGKTVYPGFNGTGVVNQTGGKFTATTLIFAQTATGNGTYHLTGGELWLGGGATRAAGAALFNLGGGRLYPFNTGFSISDLAGPRLTGINGQTRFCSTGSGFTNTVSGIMGAGGFVKEGADTLNIAGAAHGFTGPILISNGTVNVSVAMTGGNAVTVAGGSLNLGPGVTVKFSSLMVTNGLFQVASNAVPVITGTSPWARVAGTGTLRLLAGAKLLCLDVSESGTIDLSAGGTATAYRFSTNGVELALGYYTSANCAAITGAGTLAVILQKDRRYLSDTFSRADDLPAFDSLGKTETGGADWAEFLPADTSANSASVTNGELRMGVGSSDPGLALTAASWPNCMAATRMRFSRVGVAGATVKNGIGLLLRRNISIRTGSMASASPDWAGAVHVLMTAAGGVFLRENYDVSKYYKNPFTGGDYLTYGAAGSLPTSINGLPFDADGDGRLEDNEPFDLKAVLSGTRLQVLINDEPVMAFNGFAAPNVAAENCAGFWKNRLSSANVETHDTYHDTFAVTNVPYLIRHIGRFDPNIAALSPRENWTYSGNTNLTPVGPVTETIGAETVDAWRIDDPSAAAGSVGMYTTAFAPSEIDDVNTNRWRLTLRLRVVNASDAVDAGVSAQVATTNRSFYLEFGSDASGNALVRLNSGTVATVPGGSVYHTYTLDYNPATASVDLSCDGVLLRAGVTGGTYTLNRVYFGANASSAIGCAHYQLAQFSILWPEPPPPPLPPGPPPPKGTLLRLM